MTTDDVITDSLTTTNMTIATEQNAHLHDSHSNNQNKLMLTVDKLSIVTNTGVTLVDNLSYALRQGRTLAIVGESGSGKSIASLALLGLLPDSLTVSGEVKLAGLTVLPIANANVSAKARNAALRSIRGQRIGMVFQEPMTALNPLHTVAKQIAESLRLVGVPKKQWQSQTIDLLNDVNITNPIDKLNRYPHELSGGQRQRVALARALIMQPSLLILDEPTSALDSTTQVTVVSLLREIQEKLQISYVFISHDLKVVRALCQQIMVLKDGICIESGRTEDVFNSPQHPYAQQLLQASMI